MSRTQRSGGSYKAPEKESSESSQNTGGLGISGSVDIGNVNGIDISARARFGIDGLIPKQGIDIEQDVTNNTTKIGLGLGSAKGKLGGNIGIKLGHDKDGNIVVKEAEVGINISGFGGEVSVDDEGNTKTSVSVAGAKIEVGLESNGDVTISTCYGITGGEICIDFKKPKDSPTRSQTPKTDIKGFEKPIYPIPTPGNYCTIFFGVQIFNYSYQPSENKIGSDTYTETGSFDGKVTILGWTGEAKTTRISTGVTSVNPYYSPETMVFPKFSGTLGAPYYVSRNYHTKGHAVTLAGQEENIYKIIEEVFSLDIKSEGTDGGKTINQRFYRILGSSCSKNPPLPPPAQPDLSSNSLSNPPPNRPNRIKRMSGCCDKVEEIYKYLGIEKLKKRKFKMAKAFLVPKGTGDETCEDFYEIYENLVRMLANGLIINPIAKPLGSDWQTPNATAWGAQMYAMMAESMSNGDSTQRFEMHAASQLIQMMKVIAELSSKVDFITEVLGITPKPVPSELPVLFTIHENHKGFEKKEPKEIDISKAKTDADVEKVLGKMFQPSRIPYIKYTFDPNHISIAKAISKL